MLLLVAAVAFAAPDRCPFQRETWNLYDDDDGCPDGVSLVVRVWTAEGAPVRGAVVWLAVPAAADGERGVPLFVEPGVSRIEVENGPERRVTGSHAYAAAAVGAPRWTFRVDASTGRDGAARFEGLRPGVVLTARVAGAAAELTIGPLGEEGATVEVVLPAGPG